MRTLMAWLLWMPSAWAATTCVSLTLPSSVSQTERNYVCTNAALTAESFGETVSPGSCTRETGQVCWSNPTSDVVSNVTVNRVHDTFVAQEALRQTATAAEVTRQQGFDTEITSNTLCTAELSTIDAAIDTLVNPVLNLADAKAAMKTGLKQVARCLRARSH